MAAQPDRAAYLLKKYANDEASAEEIGEMLELLKQREEVPALEQLIHELRNTVRQDAVMQEPDWEKIWDTIQYQGQRKGILRRMTIRRIAVAACLLAALGFLFWLLLNKRTQSGNTKDQLVKTDIPAPDKNRARVLLANGQEIYLDSTGSGELAMQGNIRITKIANGELNYQLAYGTDTGRQNLNSLINPRGSRIAAIRLSDGTRVWLNAGSSVSYPAAFTGNERKVTVDGEAYFEVAQNHAKPFIVTNGKLNITVLGTRFNVHAYNNENTSSVSLLDGSVKLDAGSSSAILKPGQQAILTDRIQTITETDIDRVMAWKNGRFEFGANTSLSEIMLEISRWYDMEVEFRDQITQGFGGGFSRQESISEVLKKLELTNRVHFTVEGRKIIVQK